MTRVRNFLSAVLLLLMIGGCAVDPAKMVPEMSLSSGPKFAGSLKINTVTGTEKEVFSGPAYIQPDEFQQGLLLTLERSGLFRTVATDKPGDYQLNANFVVQGQTSQGLSFLSSMVIEYTLIDSSSEKVIWTDSFNSTAKRTVSQDFAGGTRSTNAQIYCARANLMQLVAALQKLDVR